MKKDIESLEDVKLFVDEFYRLVDKNELIGPIFEEKIAGNWQPHLEKMYRFWQTILLPEHTYSGAPFAHHVSLPIYKHHFDAWLEMFYKTIDQYFEGPKADEAKERAGKMALMFQSKLEYMRANPHTFPLA